MIPQNSQYDLLCSSNCSSLKLFVKQSSNEKLWFSSDGISILNVENSSKLNDPVEQYSHLILELIEPKNNSFIIEQFCTIWNGT